MKAAFALACLITVLASGLATGCATLPASVAPEAGSTLQEATPPMIAPARADRKTQGGRTGTASRLG